MKRCIFLAIALGLACSKKAATPSAIPPAAPNKLTSPAGSGDLEDAEPLDEGAPQDEGDVDVDAGFGSGENKPAPAPKPEAWMRDASRKVAAHAKGKTRAWDRLAEMTDTYGHRLSGSKALEDAIDWAVAVMEADGLHNVRREKVMVPKWVRGKESLQVLAPFKRELDVLGLGMSVGTKGKLRAELAVVDHVDAIAKAPKGSLAGKIVLINQVMPPFNHAERTSYYGETVKARTSGADEAAKAGAMGVLVRSVTAKSLATPHTGSLSYAQQGTKIPAAAVTHEGAELLARAAERGPVKVSLSMGARLVGDVPSANAIGELVGTDKPEEIVVIGGHIDSWDVGTGASDDGAGCLIAMEAALLLKELGLAPKRTIRVVLFTNEENGLRGGKAYFDAHGKETHVGAIESDSGSGAPWGFSVKTENKAAERGVLALSDVFKPVKASNIITGWGGADISPLTSAGVLSMALVPDVTHYFDLHHSPADTVDKIEPAHIEGNAAAMAVMAYILANR